MLPVCADMASKKYYKSSEEVLNMLFSLPSDVSESEDDLETSDAEPSTSTTETTIETVSHTRRSSPAVSEPSSDDDDDVLYRLADSDSSQAESHSRFGSASDDAGSDSDFDETSWTKGKFPSVTVDFDAIKQGWMMTKDLAGARLRKDQFFSAVSASVATCSFG